MGKKIRLITGFLTLMICIAAFSGGGKAHAQMRDITYTLGMSGTISGTVGSEITKQTFTISVGGGKSFVRPLAAGTDVSSWFKGSESPLPAGLKVTVKEDAAIGSKSFKVEFSGKVYGASKDDLKIEVQNMYFDENESDLFAYASVSFVSDIPKFNITRSATVPSGYHGVGNGIYIKDQKSGTAGWVLEGEKGKAISSNNEMQVYINGNILVPMNAGYNISDWFTGDLYKYYELFGATVGSALPDGVVARIKNKVSVGDNSFTIVFSGTPYKGSMDLIAFTIPSGFVSYDRGGISKGDLQSGCKVYNVSGNYKYSISSDNDDDIHSEFVKITYPEAVLEAGKPVTEEDNLIITYELVGEVGGRPITFTDIREGHDTVRGICYQNAPNQNPACFWNDHLTTSTGLEATIIEISEDKRTLKARIWGTPKKQTSYPYVLKGRNFILNAGKNSAGHLIAGYTSGDTTLTIVEPVLNATVDRDVTITKTADEKTATITNGTFIISLGDDTLAKSFKKGEGLGLFYPETGREYDILSDNGVMIFASKDTAAGAHQIEVYVRAVELRWDWKAYLRLAFPKDYITRMADYGTQKFYNIPFSRIWEDVVVVQEVIHDVELSDLLITGTVNNELIEEEYLHKWTEGSGDDLKYVERWEKRVTGIDLKPVGTEKLYFTVTLHHWTNIEKSYEAGDSVLDFIHFFIYDDKKTPFYMNDWEKQFVSKDFKFYDIHTVEPIAAGRTAAPRVLHLMIDLSEFYALHECDEEVKFILYYIDDSGTRPVHTNDYSDNNPKFRFNIKLKGQSSGGGADFNTGIAYNKKDVIVYAKDKTGAKTEGTYINLSTEKFVTDMDYKCYSTDGGTKWKAATKKLTDKNIASMLGKGMTLVLADKYDSKTKAPAEGAVVYTFDPIDKRPSNIKLKVDYAAFADKTGATPGQWGFTDASGTALGADVLKTLDIGVAASNGKTVSDDGYGSWPAQGGINIAPLVGSKVASTTYFVRVAPTGNTPASKVMKIKVKGQQKATKLKIDYKKEVLKAKKGTMIFFGSTPSANAQSLSSSASTYDDYAGRLLEVTEPDQVKAGVNIAPYLTDGRETILIWNAATAKKPATKPQVIETAARAPVIEKEFTVSKGKFTLPAAYEVYNEAKGSWGAMPKVTESCRLKVRMKGKAKGGKENDSTYAASIDASLIITWGVYDEDKGKEGIIAAAVICE